MRLSFVASLLFSGSIGFFELASGNNSILQTARQHYDAHKDEVLQHGQKQVRQLLSRAARTHSAGANRELQFTDAPTSAPLCNADGSVNYDSEEFNQPELYGPEVNTMCTCMQQNNAKEISEKIALLDFLNETAFVEGFNTLFGMLYSYYSYNCVNGCEACLESGVCGLLDTKETYISELTKTNFTADEIIAGPDPAPFFKNYSYSFTDCFTYTSGTLLDGKICLGVVYDEPTDATADESACFIEYDDVPCNSCFFRYDIFDYFLFADCTNIDSSATINGLDGTGFVGPFVYLEAYKGGFSTTTYTIGSCDVFSPTAPVPGTPVATPVALPTAPVTDTPVATPVAISAAPVTDTPIAAPVAVSPAPVTDTPVSAVIDTPVATPVALPPAPVAVPTAPVVAPVRTPVAAVTTPTAPVSGSFMIGVALNVLVLVATVAYLT